MSDTLASLREEWDRDQPWGRDIQFVERLFAALEEAERGRYDWKQTSHNTAHLSARFQEKAAMYAAQVIALRELLQDALTQGVRGKVIYSIAWEERARRVLEETGA